MSSDPQFQAAIDKAISHGRGNLISIAALVTVGSLLFGAFSHFTGDEGSEGPWGSVIVIVCAWALAIAGSNGMRALDKLRTAQIDHWLPSATHGLIAVAGDQLMVGSNRPFELKRQSARRVTSIIFEENTHELTVALAQGAEGDQRMVISKLEPDVTPERADAFIRHVRERVRG